MTDAVPTRLSGKVGNSCGARQYMPPDKKGSKGINWEGAYHYVRPPDDWEKVVDHRSQEERTAVVGRLSGAKRPASSDSDA